MKKNKSSLNILTKRPSNNISTLETVNESVNEANCSSFNQPLQTTVSKKKKIRYF